MKKEQMAGMRLPAEMVRELETIEPVEQSDRSTTVRKLLAKAIGEWKMYARMYGDGKLSLARASRQAGVSIWDRSEYLGNDGLCPCPQDRGTVRPGRFGS